MNAIAKEIREKAINDVKEGMSYLQAAKKHGVNYNSVSQWCRDIGVVSLQASRRKIVSLLLTDKKISDVVVLHKVITSRMLAEVLGCSGAAVNHHLQNMVMSGKVQSFRIPSVSHAARIRGIFRKHINTRIYYVSKDDLAEWVRDQFPEEVPQSLRRTVTHVFQSIGIQIFKEEKQK